MKNKTINSEKYYPITEIIYFTEKDQKYIRFALENHFDEKNFINSFQASEHLEKNFKAFFQKSLELSLEIEVMKT